MTDSKIIEAIIYEETEKRIRIMKGPGYRFPAGLTKVDKVGIVMIIVACLWMLVLCMLGWIGE